MKSALIISALILFAIVARATGPNWQLTSGLAAGVTQIAAGADITTNAANALNTVVSRKEDGKTFYLTGYQIEGFFQIISASATKLGVCYLQMPIGTDVGQFNFVNPTTSTLDRVNTTLESPLSTASGFAIVCDPLSATSINWNVNYTGFEK